MDLAHHEGGLFGDGGLVGGRPRSSWRSSRALFDGGCDGGVGGGGEPSDRQPHYWRRPGRQRRMPRTRGRRHGAASMRSVERGHRAQKC